MKAPHHNLLAFALALAALGISLAAIEQAQAVSFVETSSLTNGRGGHAATLLPSGKVLITCGYGEGNASSSAEVYEPDSNGNPPAITILHHSNQILSIF